MRGNLKSAVRVVQLKMLESKGSLQCVGFSRSKSNSAIVALMVSEI